MLAIKQNMKTIISYCVQFGDATYFSTIQLRAIHGQAAGYLLYRASSRFVLMISQYEERKCTELGMLQGRVEFRPGHFQVFVRRGAVQHKHHSLRALVVSAPVLFNGVRSCEAEKRVNSHRHNLSQEVITFTRAH